MSASAGGQGLSATARTSNLRRGHVNSTDRAGETELAGDVRSRSFTGYYGVGYKEEIRLSRGVAIC